MNTPSGGQDPQGPVEATPPAEAGAPVPDANQPAPESQEPELPPEIRGLIEQSVQSATKAVDEKYESRIREMELENARLKGQLEAGGAAGVAAQTPQFLDSQREYEYLASSLQMREQLAAAQGNEEAAQQARVAQEEVRQNYTMFQAHQQRQNEEKQTRAFARARFFADHKLPTDSDMGRYVEQLHESGVSLDEIHQQILAPRAELDELRGRDQSTAATGAAMTAATQIEPGQQREQPPAPVSRTDLTPEQEEEQAMVEHYSRHTGGGAAERALFSEDF